MLSPKFKTYLWLTLTIVSAIILVVRVFDFVLWDGQWWKLLSAFAILVCVTCFYRKSKQLSDDRNKEGAR